MKSSTDLYPDIVESRWAAAIDGDIELMFVESGYVLRKRVLEYWELTLGMELTIGRIVISANDCILTSEP